ncbi:MAG: DUF1465 family protein [Chakrabartia sp.]
MNMVSSLSSSRLTHKVIDALYLEAMVLADEARAYFDDFSVDERHHMDPVIRVAFSCESLKVTTRLMHVMAWLLTQRAVVAGEMEATHPHNPSLRLGPIVQTDADALKRLPPAAQTIITNSMDLFLRTKRIDAQLLAPETGASPARALMQQLERSF